MVSLTGGTATPAGSVSFWLCKVDAPARCGTGGTQVGGAVNLTGAAYPATVVSGRDDRHRAGSLLLARWSTPATPRTASRRSSDSSVERVLRRKRGGLLADQRAERGCRTTRSPSRRPQAATLAGSVSFALYPSATCAGATTVYSTTVAVAGASPQTSVDLEHHRGHGFSGSYSVEGQLRQHQPGAAGHRRQVPRDIGTDNHQRRYTDQPVRAGC